MKLTIDDLTFIYPDKLFLEFSQKEREQAWEQIQQQNYANVAARWNAYLNCLCLNTFLTYLETEQNLNSTAKVVPSLAELPSLWQVVNGTAIDLNSRRLVLIPSSESDLTELRVPREWMDLPNWAGNYYLAVQVNLEDGWLCVWGYATHQHLKKEGRYDRLDETYSLESYELIEDLSIMWVAQSMYPVNSNRIEVKPLPSLSASKAESLLEKLSQNNVCSPRLDVPFHEWGAFIAEDRWRRELYQRLQTSKKPEPVSERALINLGQWFQEVFEAGWQSLEALIDIESRDLSYSFRQGKYEAIELFVKGVKLIDLGMELGGQSVALLVGLTPETEERLGIRVQLHPVGKETYLPPKIELALLSQSGKILQEIQARSKDNFIQLKRFTCPVGKVFSIRVTLGDFTLTEKFIASSQQQPD